MIYWQTSRNPLQHWNEICIIWIVIPFEKNQASPLKHALMDTLILSSTKDAFGVLNPLFPPETNITDYFMADFEQRGELPALVCGASGKEITFAGKFQPKKAGSKLLSLRISYLQKWSLWAASLGRACSTWAWKPETRWPCLRPIVQRYFTLLSLWGIGSYICIMYSITL